MRWKQLLEIMSQDCQADSDCWHCLTPKPDVKELLRGIGRNGSGHKNTRLPAIQSQDIKGEWHQKSHDCDCFDGQAFARCKEQESRCSQDEEDRSTGFHRGKEVVADGLPEIVVGLLRINMDGLPSRRIRSFLKIEKVVKNDPVPEEPQDDAQAAEHAKDKQMTLDHDPTLVFDPSNYNDEHSHCNKQSPAIVTCEGSQEDTCGCAHQLLGLFVLCPCQEKITG